MKLATLKKGYWEETAVHRRPDGSKVVRKSSRAGGEAGPWARDTLLREIRYLETLPPNARVLFPPLMRAWGTEPDTADSARASELGYEIPFYEDRLTVSEKLQRQPWSAAIAEAFQSRLAERLFDHLHEPVVTPTASLAAHVRQALANVMDALQSNPEPDWEDLVEAPQVTLNDRPGVGLRRQWDRVEASGILERLDLGPRVRLHGDLILENILCPSGDHDFPWWDDLLLIDPVSVAGVSEGPPLFDLVKYESYASGELLAIRSGWCLALKEAPGRYRFEPDLEHEALQPYRHGRWHACFRSRFEERHGPVDPSLAHLLDGYFSLVMAVNTTGKQRKARLLKGLHALRLVLVA